MFAPVNVERRRQVAIHVQSAMNATTIAQLQYSAGKISLQQLQGVLKNIFELSLEEIMKIPSITISNINPSDN